MTAPLLGEAGLIGSMVVANRLTEGTTFTDDDLRLLETLANQAAVALENGQLEQSLAELSRLKEQLRFQAYHDPLTGLANRSLFAEQVNAALAVARRRPGAGRPVPRPRQLQGRQRRPRAPRGRPAAHRGRRARPVVRPGRRHGGQARRRRVRDPAARRAGPRRRRHRRLAADRRVRRHVPGRRPGPAGLGEHRHRRQPRRERPRRRPAAQRRRGDVHGQAGRQEPVRRVRADHARGDRGAARDVHGAVPRRGRRRDRRLLPAGAVARDGRDLRRGGPRPLAPPDPRVHRARRVHPPGRGERGDPRARPRGAVRGLPRGRPVARRRGRGHLADRQPLRRPARPGDVHRRPRRHPALHRVPGHAPGPRDDRDRDVHRHADDHRPAHGPARPRRPDRGRRLRHRLLVAGLPAPVQGRHPQDRARVHRDVGVGARRLGVRVGDRRARALARAADHRGGHRGRRPARAAPRDGLRARAGLPVREGDAGRGDGRAPPAADGAPDRPARVPVAPALAPQGA